MDIDRMADQELEKLGLKKKEEEKPTSRWGSDRYSGGGWKDPDYWSKKSASSPRRSASSDPWGRGTESRLEAICQTQFNTHKYPGEAVISHVGLDKIVTELRSNFLTVLDKSKVLVVNGRQGNDALYMAIEELVVRHCTYMTPDVEYLDIVVEDR